MLTPEKVSAHHAAYANDREPGAFERVLRAVWDDACEACAEACEEKARGGDAFDAMAEECAEACHALKTEAECGTRS